MEPTLETRIERLLTKAHPYFCPDLLKTFASECSTYSTMALRTAVKCGDVELVRLLLQHPAVDPGAGNNYALKYASGCGSVHIVQLLLDHPDTDPWCTDALRVAERNGHVEVAMMLLERLTTMGSFFVV